MNRSIPVEAQLPFSIIGFRLDQPAFQRDPVDSPNKAALRFGLNVVLLVGRTRKPPEPVPSKKIFPAAVGNPAWILRVAYPHAVVLQTAENVVRISIVRAHVIELRDGKIVPLPPSVAAIVRIPNASVIRGDNVIGIVRIHPHIVKIAVRAVPDSAEALPSVLAHDQREVWLVHFVLVFRINDQIGEVKRPPYHPIAAVPLFPRLATIVGAE